MKKAILILFLIFPLAIQAQILDGFRKKIPTQAPPPQSSSPSSSNSGNQTNISINEPTAQKAPEPGMFNSGWEEADWNLSISTLPYIFIDQPGERQFIVNPKDALDVGAHYKFSPKISIWLRYVTITAKGASMENTFEKVKYDDEGEPLYDDEGKVITYEDREKYETAWFHERIFWGLSWRFNFGENNKQQVQLGLGTSLYDKIEETESETKIQKLGATMVVDVKYLWVTNNTAWGMQMTIVDTPSKQKDSSKYMKGGYMWVAAVVEIGFVGLN